LLLANFLLKPKTLFVSLKRKNYFFLGRPNEIGSHSLKALLGSSDPYMYNMYGLFGYR
jgi:hypothetical protein